MLYLAAFIAVVLTMSRLVIIGSSVCEVTAAEQATLELQISILCNNDYNNLTLSWNSTKNVQQVSLITECTNGTNTVYNQSYEDINLSPRTSSSAKGGPIFRWPVKCSIRVCYYDSDLRGSYSVHPTSCMFSSSSMLSTSIAASGTTFFPPSTKDFPTSIDSIDPSTTSFHMYSPHVKPTRTSAPPGTSHFPPLTKESFAAISTIITEKPNVTSFISSSHVKPTRTSTSQGTIQTQSSVTENLPSSVIISVAVAVSITIIGIAVLLSTCWIFTMILKRRRQQDDYNSMAISVPMAYDPIILSLTRPSFCESTITITCPLENEKNNDNNTLSCTPACITSSSSLEIQGTNHSEDDLLDLNKLQHTTVYDSHDHTSGSTTNFNSDFKSDPSAKSSLPCTFIPVFSFTRRHSYESINSTYQSDYIMFPSSIDSSYNGNNSCQTH